MISPRFAWLHFALIGAFLCGGEHFMSGPDAGPGATAAGIDWAHAPEDQVLYREALRRELGRRDSVVRRRLVQNMRFLESAREEDDEVLYREALALGLDRSDRVVKRRLVEAMRQTLIAENTNLADSPPDDAALRAHLAENRQRFVQPARRRIEQLYYATAQRAREALANARESGGNVAAAELAADPFPLRRELPLLSPRELAARFGPGFASEVFALPVAQRSRPIDSSYGSHLVVVVEHLPARTPNVAELRGALVAHWTAEREESALRKAVAALRRVHASERAL